MSAVSGGLGYCVDCDEGAQLGGREALAACLSKNNNDKSKCTYTFLFAIVIISLTLSNHTTTSLLGTTFPSAFTTLVLERGNALCTDSYTGTKEWDAFQAAAKAERSTRKKPSSGDGTTIPFITVPLLLLLLLLLLTLSSE